ncbi:MAG: hypothetical protein WCW47_00310 [Candidatus Paceibacterota bacterium]|jgi:hypothetical protein
MINKYKKGDLVSLTYEITPKKDVMQAIGIVYKISDSQIVICHNFSGVHPIDTTKIYLKNILKSEYIVPNEIKNLDDLKRVEN